MCAFCCCLPLDTCVGMYVCVRAGACAGHGAPPLPACLPAPCDTCVHCAPAFLMPPLHNLYSYLTPITTCPAVAVAVAPTPLHGCVAASAACRSKRRRADAPAAAAVFACAGPFLSFLLDPTYAQKNNKKRDSVLDDVKPTLSYT